MLPTSFPKSLFTFDVILQLGWASTAVSSDQGLHLKNFDKLVTIVGEVGLCLETLILYHYLVVEAGGLILGLKGTEVLFLTVHHDKDLPRAASVLRDSAEARATEERLGIVLLILGSLSVVHRLRASVLLLSGRN